jgi:hypothetical protein
MAITLPHTAHSAFVHGIRHRWTYLQRTHEDVDYLFAHLEATIRTKFITSLLDGRQVSDSKRSLLALPGRLGGLALDFFSAYSYVK